MAESLVLEKNAGKIYTLDFETDVSKMVGRAGDQTQEHLVIFIYFSLSLPLSQSGRFCHRNFATVAESLVLEKNAAKIYIIDFETDVSKVIARAWDRTPDHLEFSFIFLSHYH